MIFLFLKKVCGHGDESVNLRGTVCWVILKAVKFKNTWNLTSVGMEVEKLET